jgi:hypothetical protein
LILPVDLADDEREALLAVAKAIADVVRPAG